MRKQNTCAMKNEENYNVGMLEDSAAVLYRVKNTSLRGSAENYGLAYDEWSRQELSMQAVVENVKEAISQIGDKEKWLTDEEAGRRLRRDLPWLK